MREQFELSPKERVDILTKRLENLRLKGASTDDIAETVRALNCAEEDLFLERCEKGAA